MTAPGLREVSPLRAVLAALAAALLVLLLSAGSPDRAAAAPDPAGCTGTIQYDPSIPTFAQVAATASPAFSTNNGQSTNTLGCLLYTSDAADE